MNVTESDVDSALAFLRDKASNAADALATRRYMEHWIKTVLAEQMKKFPELPVAAQEREARVSPAYLAALQALRDAIKDDATWSFWREAASIKVEVWRTLEATKRAESRGYQ